MELTALNRTKKLPSTFEKVVRLFIVKIRNTSITEDTNKLIVLIISDSRSLWKVSSTPSLDTTLSKAKDHWNLRQFSRQCLNKYTLRSEKVVSLVPFFSKVHFYKRYEVVWGGGGD